MVKKWKFDPPLHLAPSPQKKGGVLKISRFRYEIGYNISIHRGQDSKFSHTRCSEVRAQLITKTFPSGVIFPAKLHKRSKNNKKQPRSADVISMKYLGENWKYNTDKSRGREASGYHSTDNRSSRKNVASGLALVFLASHGKWNSFLAVELWEVFECLVCFFPSVFLLMFLINNGQSSDSATEEKLGFRASGRSQSKMDK